MQEEKFIRRVKECTKLDKCKNVETKKKLSLYLLNDTIRQYKTSWNKHC